MRKTCDFLIIGSGIAGLNCALEASQYGTVLIVTKKEDSQTNTNRAQGGIACVLDTHDDYSYHIQDTLEAGRGLCNREVVETIVKEGPKRLKELIDFGINFTPSKEASNKYGFDLGREGGHSKNRIVHAEDLTGKEVEQKLLAKIKESPDITLLEHHTLVELITEHHITPGDRSNTCFGAYIFDTTTNSIGAVEAHATILATGGTGRVYYHTTNPEIATGDGIACAYRAGATIANMEFIQFHPTMLYYNGNDPFLISEALRGYGAVLKDKHGKKFMNKYSSQGSLAPRDIVAYAIDKELKISGEPCVYLDITDFPSEDIINKFPNIYTFCLENNIDITKSMIPVVPAAHYSCGGIKTGINGETSLKSLFACGEVACTGMHGANRLASNSLLEALVLSKRVALKSSGSPMMERPLNNSIPDWNDEGTIHNEEWILLAHNKEELRRLMWNYVGIVRSSFRLKRARRRIKLLKKETEKFYRSVKISYPLVELRNLITVAELIVNSAILRKESRGLHYTIDYPESDDRNFKKDTLINKENNKI